MMLCHTKTVSPNADGLNVLNVIWSVSRYGSLACILSSASDHCVMITPKMIKLVVVGCAGAFEGCKQGCALDFATAILNLLYLSHGECVVTSCSQCLCLEPVVTTARPV